MPPVVLEVWSGVLSGPPDLCCLGGSAGRAPGYTFHMLENALLLAQSLLQISVILCLGSLSLPGMSGGAFNSSTVGDKR